MSHIEEWRDVNGYEGIYQVSNTGRVRSLNFNHKGIIRELKQSWDARGYRLVGLTKNNRCATKRVHRLVAETFVPNPNGLPCVNHIDENKENNNATNLEWCDVVYNNRYGNRTDKTSNPVVQIDLNGNVIKKYKSAKEAGKSIGIHYSHITRCCQDKPHYHTVGGYKWKYLFERKRGIKIEIHDLPQHLETSHIVAKKVDGKLKFVGCYVTQQKAEEMAERCDGIALERA